MLIATIAILLAAPFLWFRANNWRPILGEDAGLLGWEYRGGSTWTSLVGLGQYNDGLPLFPYTLTLRWMSEVFSLLVAQVITAYLVILVAFASFYFLVMDLAKGIDSEHDSSVLAKHRSNWKTLAGLAAFLYTFNAYTLASWYFGWGAMLLLCALAPVVLLCLHRGASEYMSTRVLARSTIAWLSLSALLTLLMPLADPTLSLPWVLFSLGFVYSSTARRQRRFARNVVIIGIPFSFYLLFVALGSAWWFLPFSYELQATAATRIPGSSSVTFLSGGSSSLLQLLRLVGEGSGFYEAGRVPGAEYLLGVVPTMTSFGVVIFALTALLGSNRTRIARGLAVFLGLVLILSLSVLTGVNPPLGNLNLWLFEHFLFFRALRAPWHRVEFFVIMSISLLFFLAATSFLGRLRVSLKGTRLPVAEIFLLSILLVNSAPLISGSIFASHGYPINGPKGVEIRVIHPYTGALPDGYARLTSYLNSQPERFNIIALPFSPFYAAFTWGYAGSWNFLTQALNKPVIDLGIGYWGYNTSVIRILQRVAIRIYEDPHPGVGAALAQYLNVKYAVVLGDWDVDFIEAGWGGTRALPSLIAQGLLKSGFILERTFGMIGVFRNEYWTGDTTFTVANRMLALTGDLRVAPNADAALDYMMWSAIDERRLALVSSSQESSKYPAPSITVNRTIRAADFGGTEECIAGGNITVSLPNQLTVHLWMYINSSKTASMVAASQGSEPNQYWALQIQPGSVRDRAVAFIDQFQTLVSVTVPTERFFMYDAVVSNESISVYVNGRLAGTANTTVGLPPSENQPLFVGRRVDGFYFSGSIMNFQMYNAALSSDDLSTIWAAGIYGGPLSDRNLLVWYLLNEAAHDTVPDMSGMGHDGTNNNVVWRQVGVEDVRYWSSPDESALHKDNVVLSYLRVSDSKWTVRINATSSFVLIFDQLFHPGWHAYYGEREWWQLNSANKMPDNLHYLASGYANAWYINRTGAFNITIEFFPEIALQIGIPISLGTIALCVSLVLRVTPTTNRKTRSPSEAFFGGDHPCELE